jgi:hypothetical protein
MKQRPAKRITVTPTETRLRTTIMNPINRLPDEQYAEALEYRYLDLSTDPVSNIIK